MENIQQQVAALQKSVQRQRIAIFVLAGICTAGVLVGATKPTEDATFDTITCKEIVVVDRDAMVRIVAATSAYGTATLTLSDKGGRSPSMGRAETPQHQIAALHRLSLGCNIASNS